MAAMETGGYHSGSDPDYQPGDEVETVTRPRTGSETQADSSFNGSTVASSFVSRSGRSRRSSMATSVSTTKSAPEKISLPYWVKAISKAEKFDPDLGKFVADDKYYKEERDPDYVLPESDVDVDTEEDEEDPEELSQLQKEAGDNLPEEIRDGKYKDKKKVSSPVKVTLTPAKEGETETAEEILTLESDEEEGEKTEGEEKTVYPQLWEKCLVLTEQPEEYDSGDDPEYVPPPVILDTSFEYDEFFEEEEVISDNEVEMLKAEAGKDLQTPACYMPIWVAVESPSERIQRAKDQYVAKAGAEMLQEPKLQAEMSNDTSGKDTDSNGKTDPDDKEVITAPGVDPKAPKAQRERKKSKSKDDKNVEKIGAIGETPKSPSKVEATGEIKSPKKKSPEKITKSPKKPVDGEQKVEAEKNPELKN